MTDAPRPEGYKAKKSLGQNFLVDPTVCPRIADRADIQGKGVIEIGPGFGALTSELCKRAARVVAIEIDEDVIPTLTENMSRFDNFSLIHGDAAELDLNEVIRQHFGDMPVAVVGNLPYYITSPLVMKLLDAKLNIESITVMVQKEPGVRFCAKPGTKECGAVSAAVWYRAVPSLLFDVKPGAFRPQPKVMSCVMRLVLRGEPPVSVRDEELFFKVVRGAFGQRRKTAANAISSLLSIPREKVNTALKDAGLDESVRAEKITLEGFAALTDKLAEII